MDRLYTSKKQLVRDDLTTKGFSVLARTDIHLAPELELPLASLGLVYDDSPSDGPVRRRFYGRYVLGPYATVDTLDLRLYSSSYMSSDYQQPADINPEQRGSLRTYAPLPAAAGSNAFLKELILFDLSLLPLEDFWPNAPRNPLSIGIHLLRTIALPERPGSPSPSVPHQDGEPFTCIHLIKRRGVNGGESQVFRNTPIDGVNAAGQLLLQTTLQQALDSLIVWDRDVFHHVTPINVVQDGIEGIRDVLIIDFTPLEECKLSSRGDIAFSTHSFCMDWQSTCHGSSKA
jgi:hypothetical protein